MRSIKGCVSWVSGGGTGIGQSVAIELAKAGATVIVSGRRQEPLEKPWTQLLLQGGPQNSS